MYIYLILQFIASYLKLERGRRGRMVVGFTATYMQSVPITTNVVRSNPTQTIQQYVIKFISDLRHFDDFLRVPRFPPPTKTILSLAFYIALAVIW